MNISAIMVSWYQAYSPRFMIQKFAYSSLQLHPGLIMTLLFFFVVPEQLPSRDEKNLEEEERTSHFVIYFWEAEFWLWSFFCVWLRSTDKKERDPTCALSLTVVVVVVIVVVFLFLNLSKAKRQSRLLSNRWQKTCWRGVTHLREAKSWRSLMA